jgi:hypothetical protein
MTLINCFSKKAEKETEEKGLTLKYIIENKPKIQEVKEFMTIMAKKCDQDKNDIYDEKE